ncbi:hypothetical protein, partial [Romboutsia sp.]|uniref:hypothetical protein n=1 Tax=Romboutsia sp. TaxID=1965302 RepID=UPI002C295173
MRSFIFFVEGIHDVNCVARVLLLRGFVEARAVNQLPDMWKSRVPRSYPFINDRLDRHIPMPAYFLKNNLCVAI